MGLNGKVLRRATRHCKAAAAKLGSGSATAATVYQLTPILACADCGLRRLWHASIVACADCGLRRLWPAPIVACADCGLRRFWPAPIVACADCVNNLKVKQSSI